MSKCSLSYVNWCGVYHEQKQCGTDCNVRSDTLNLIEGRKYAWTTDTEKNFLSKHPVMEVLRPTTDKWDHMKIKTSVQ